MDNEQSDDDVMMDHIALECMHAIDAKDKQGFKDAFHVLVAHTIHSMGMGEQDDDDKDEGK